MQVIMTVDIAVITTIGRKLHQILLVQRGKEPFQGSWVMPGGHLEPDEDLRDAALRELKEEAGISLERKDLEFLDLMDSLNRKDYRPGRRISAVYLVYLRHDDPRLKDLQAGSDAQNAKFWSFEDLNQEEIGFDHWDIVGHLRDMALGR